jgi:hypothetical protein
MFDAPGNSTLLLDRPVLPGFPPEGGQPALVVADLPRHHRDRPHVLASALAAAKQILPDSAWLADEVLPLMPRRPRASQNLRAITRDPSSSPFLLDEAITLPWCSGWVEDMPGNHPQAG